jgi:macrolide transport system ATP-binding/permease protein
MVDNSGWGTIVAGSIADVQYAARRLRAAPGFAAVAVLMLAVAIGANTAVFTLLDALYMKPLHAPNAERLVHVYSRGPGGHLGAGFSFDEYGRLARRLQKIDPLAAVTPVAQLHLQTDSGSREVRGEFVTANYFSVLGIAPWQGRWFGAEEDTVTGRDPVVVVSYRLWETVLSSDRASLDRPVRLNGTLMTVVGVTPPGFAGDDVGRGSDVWIPMAMLRTAGYGCEPGRECPSVDALVGRLAKGTDVRSAQVDAESKVLWTASIDGPGHPRRIVVDPIAGADPETRALLRPQMELLLALAVLLLVAACANLAGLVLARGVGRAHEIAIRLSIGASRLRVIRQMAIEGVVLAATALPASLLASRWGVALLSGFYNLDSEGFAHSYDFGMDERVIAHALAIAAATGVLIGILPALHMSRGDVTGQLRGTRGGAGATSERRVQNALVVAQVAMALLFAVAASLLVSSRDTVVAGTHFDPSNVIVFRLRPRLARFTPAQSEALARAVMQRLHGTAGVQAAGMMIGGEGLVWNAANGPTLAVSLPRDRGVDARTLEVNTQDIDSGLFDVLGVPIVAGRAFTDADQSGAAHVAIVNDTLARRLWPRDSAIDRIVVVDGAPSRVVGVVADIQPPNPMAAPLPHLYRPFWQTPATQKEDVRFAVRVAGDPAVALGKIRAVVRLLEPSVPIAEDMPLATQLRLEYAPLFLASRVTLVCGVLALCFSAIALYSSLALSVRRRTREIGIRLAIGARPQTIARGFLKNALTLSAVGIGAGLVAAWIAMQLIQTWLYGVDAHRLSAFATAVAVLVVTTLLAAYVPSRRAAHVDPLVALRDE